MKIRNFKISDSKNLSELNLFCFKEPTKHLDFLKFGNDKNYKIFIGEFKNNLVGYLVIRVIQSEDLCEIISIGVHPDLRNRGFGANLMSFLINYLKENNSKKIILEVANSNFSANKLYEKYNFKSISVRKAYYLNNEDANIMVLKLD
jgi:ribosomal-protein-alanine N-acetyltransferase